MTCFCVLRAVIIASALNFAVALIFWPQYYADVLMRPIVTDGVAWSVGLSVDLPVCHDCEPCKNGRTDRDAVWVVDLGGSEEPCIGRGSTSADGKGQFWGGERGGPL